MAKKLEAKDEKIIATQKEMLYSVRAKYGNMVPDVAYMANILYTQALMFEEMKKQTELLEKLVNGEKETDDKEVKPSVSDLAKQYSK